MKVLVAEDDKITRRLLEVLLAKWGYETTSVGDGGKAWDVLQQKNSFRLVVLDWMMPEMDGAEVCRKVRNNGHVDYKYILLLTAKSQKEDIIEGIRAGADDYLIKPFDRSELRARISIGKRIVELQQALAGRVREL